MRFIEKRVEIIDLIREIEAFKMCVYFFYQFKML
jgi:hypothetical protein